jgi:hypothetical protein
MQTAIPLCFNARSQYLARNRNQVRISERSRCKARGKTRKAFCSEQRRLRSQCIRPVQERAFHRAEGLRSWTGGVAAAFSGHFQAICDSVLDTRDDTNGPTADHDDGCLAWGRAACNARQWPWWLAAMARSPATITALGSLAEVGVDRAAKRGCAASVHRVVQMKLQTRLPRCRPSKPPRKGDLLIQPIQIQLTGERPCSKLPPNVPKESASTVCKVAKAIVCHARCPFSCVAPATERITTSGAHVAALPSRPAALVFSRWLHRLTVCATPAWFLQLVITSCPLVGAWRLATFRSKFVFISISESIHARRSIAVQEIFLVCFLHVSPR